MILVYLEGVACTNFPFLPPICPPAISCPAPSLLRQHPFMPSPLLNAKLKLPNEFAKAQSISANGLQICRDGLARGTNLDHLHLQWCKKILVNPALLQLC